MPRTAAATTGGIASLDQSGSEAHSFCSAASTLSMSPLWSEPNPF